MSIRAGAVCELYVQQMTACNRYFTTILLIIYFSVVQLFSTMSCTLVSHLPGPLRIVCELYCLLYMFHELQHKCMQQLAMHVAIPIYSSVAEINLSAEGLYTAYRLHVSLLQSAIWSACAHACFMPGQCMQQAMPLFQLWEVIGDSCLDQYKGVLLKNDCSTSTLCREYSTLDISQLDQNFIATKQRYNILY